MSAAPKRTTSESSAISPTIAFALIDVTSVIITKNFVSMLFIDILQACVMIIGARISG
jgi:hypothetical protein